MNVHHKAEIPPSLAALTPEKAPGAVPQIAFVDAAGTRHALGALKGRWVLLNMWATWCVPCVSELPALVRLKAQVPGLQVLAVDLTGRNETAAMSEAFLKTHQAGALGALVDADVTFMRSFAVVGLPTTILIDPQGKVYARAEGPAQWSAPESVDYFKDLVGS